MCDKISFDGKDPSIECGECASYIPVHDLNAAAKAERGDRGAVLVVLCVYGAAAMLLYGLAYFSVGSGLVNIKQGGRKWVQ